MRKKKWLSLLLVCAIFLGVLQGVVFAETIAPNIVAHYTFDSDTDGWWLYGNGSSTLGRERVAPNSNDYCIAAYGRPDAWTSPAIDIYELIRAVGPGTYTVQAAVKTDSASGHKTRILLRSNKENSFIKNQGTDYHMWLSVGPDTKKNEWTTLSGSFKILPSDVSESTGQLLLCFDSLVDETTRSALYINDVIICKLSNTGATNGTFEYGTVGWRNWGGYGTLGVGTQYKFGNLIPVGNYLKASTYGSIACNVDQILSNYGRVTYQVDFDLYLASYSLEAVDKLTFYLSKGEYQYHYFIQQKGKSELVHGWQHISLEIDTSAIPYNIGSDILYDLLQPNTREVFFRIQYDPGAGASENDEEYGITNFTFRPKNQANYVPSQSLVLSDTTLELTPGQSYQLTATLLPSNATYKGVEWKTTNGYYVGVNQYGLVTAHGKPGTSAVITAQSEDGVCIAWCKVTVRSTDPFHPSNVSSIRYTRIPSHKTIHLISLIESTLYEDEIFVVQNLNNGTSQTFLVNEALKNELETLEAAYYNHLIPPTYASKEESCAHAAKRETDQLVDAGYIADKSNEYYGIWASNYAEEFLILDYWEGIIDKATAMYSVYIAAATYYYSSLASQISTTINSSQYAEVVDQVDDLVKSLTNNPSSNKVMLGTSYNGTTWYQVAEQQGMTYFYSPNWENYVAQYGDDMMRSVNMDFLFRQKQAGKQFWFSHDPMIYVSDPTKAPSFAAELDWLRRSYGLSQLNRNNFIESGGYWYFSP